jgi:hypothetical protein
MVRTDDSHRQNWQARLRPFMVWMLAGLTVFFFLSSLVQLVYLHQRILEGPQLPSTVLLRESTCPPAWTSEACLAQRRFDTQAVLEADLIARRYHQANVVLMSSVWSRYLGFVTGMTLALVGAAFILGQIDTDTSELGGRGGGWELSLKSASPGLVLSVLGVVLMIASIVTLHEIHTRDVAVYLGADGVGGDVQLPPVDLRPPSASAPSR